MDYPIDYEKNIFEKRKLRFYYFLNYKVTEVPFGHLPTILDFKDFGTIIYSIGIGRNKIEIERKKVEFNTNCGTRSIEFTRFELLNMNKE